MREKSILQIIIDTICQVGLFVFIQYILACFYLSFQNNFLSIFLVAGNAGVIMHLWEYLSHGIESKIIKCTILLVSIIIVGAILLLCGYFPVSTALREVSL